MKSIDHNQNYKSVRIKTETYKNIKRLAIDLDIPVTRLIEQMFKEYLEKNARIDYLAN